MVVQVAEAFQMFQGLFLAQLLHQGMEWRCGIPSALIFHQLFAGGYQHFGERVVLAGPLKEELHRPLLVPRLVRGHAQVLVQLKIAREGAYQAPHKGVDGGDRKLGPMMEHMPQCGLGQRRCFFRCDALVFSQCVEQIPDTGILPLSFAQHPQIEQHALLHLRRRLVRERERQYPPVRMRAIGLQGQQNELLDKGVRFTRTRGTVQHVQHRGGQDSGPRRRGSGMMIVLFPPGTRHLPL